MPAWLGSGEDLPPGSCIDTFPLCPHVLGGVEALSGVSFRRALIPFVRAEPADHPTAYSHHLRV